MGKHSSRSRPHAPAGKGLSQIRRIDLLIVFLILLTVYAFSWLGVRNKSATVDEVAHILAGHSYWTLNDFRLVPESGNLPNRVASLPLQFIDQARPIATNSKEWANSEVWELARDWWYGPGGNPEHLLALSRNAMLAFNLFGLVVLFVISAAIWGRLGGYFSLIVAGFSPNFLGHMPLATSDFAVSWTLAAAVVAYANLISRPSVKAVFLTGILAGLAILSKQTGLLIGPVALILLLVQIVRIEEQKIEFGKIVKKFRGRVRVGLILLVFSVAAALITWGIIWMAYGFRYQAESPDAGYFSQFYTEWEQLDEAGSVIGHFVSLAAQLKLLPEAFLYGLDFILANEDRGGFLNGLYSSEGHPFYFLWSFLYKTPLPAIGIHLIGLISVMGLVLGRKLDITFPLLGLIVLGLTYGCLLMTTSLNIGYRHAFPLLFVSCILSAAPLASLRPRSRHWYLLGLWVMVLSLPLIAWKNQNRYISFMNTIGGWAERGYQHLGDSSLDWGQDIPAARDYINGWCKENPTKEVYLSTFGTVIPEAYGLSDTHFLEYWGFRERRAFLPRLTAGLYVITPNAMAIRDWTLSDELAYLDTKERVGPLYGKLSEAGDWSIGKANELLTPSQRRTLEEFEKMRFRRLIFALSSLQPDTVINGTFLVFDLSADEFKELNWD
jgi:hypothetical protein